MAKVVRKRPRHIFRFKIQTGLEGDKTEVLKCYAEVIMPKKPVKLVLKADDVRRSMTLKGIGNTQTCSMAVCAKRQADAFPHPVQGYIDWQYSRCYVVTKVNKATGLPSHCVVYAHKDDIAKLNDSKGGQAILLADLETNGDRTIHLRVPEVRAPRPGRINGVSKVGAHSSRPAAVGAKLRFATAMLGGAI